MAHYGKRAMRGMSVYHRKLKATIYPWSHPTETWVGFAYSFDDPDVLDMLVYFVPDMDEATMGYYCHMTRIWVLKKGEGVKLDTGPDPKTDAMMDHFPIDPAL